MIIRFFASRFPDSSQDTERQERYHHRWRTQEKVCVSFTFSFCFTLSLAFGHKILLHKPKTACCPYPKPRIFHLKKSWKKIAGEGKKKKKTFPLSFPLFTLSSFFSLSPFAVSQSLSIFALSLSFGSLDSLAFPSFLLLPFVCPFSLPSFSLS